ncbi:hypothetical protein VNI00_012668 [Paramarasmius palmivorus]|uniref:Nuclear fusion protein KAR5 n=1 Tax=Paramarasmius palmivorus TaxID=297713 RepID=A0AAW0C513_9AGAR
MVSFSLRIPPLLILGASFLLGCYGAVSNLLGGAWHENEIGALLLKRDALVEYSQRSDCFRNVADVIRLRCERLDMDEKERVEAAISMTLCELATAKHHSIPLECSSFSIKQPPSFDTQPDSRSECVSALSRSAQFWSSYSGYLREIPQLCFTFQRWHDIDIARNIYHNITVEKLAFVKLLQEQEREKAHRSEAWMNGLADLINITTYMRDISQQIEDSSIAARSRLQMIEGIAAAVSSLLKQSEHDRTLSIKRTDDALSVLTENYSILMQNLMSDLEERLNIQLGRVFAKTQDQHQMLFGALIAAEERWRYFQREFWSTRESFVQLSHLATHTALELYNIRNHTVDLHETHTQLSRAAHLLNDQMTQMNTQTQRHFDTLNNSAVALRQTLTESSETSGPPGWWRDALLAISSLVFRTDTATILEYTHSPIYRVSYAAWVALFWLMKHSLSLLTVRILKF